METQINELYDIGKVLNKSTCQGTALNPAPLASSVHTGLCWGQVLMLLSRMLATRGDHGLWLVDAQAYLSKFESVNI